MSKIFCYITIITTAFVTNSLAIWIPSQRDDLPVYQEQGMYEPPAAYSSDSSYTWVEIPDVGVVVLPPKANASASTSAPPESERQHATAEEDKSEQVATQLQSESAIPRFNDVSCDIEYGIISFKPKFGAKYSGFSISTKLRYERVPNDYCGYGLRADNEFTKYKSYQNMRIPASDFLLVGGFYRKMIVSNLEVGLQANASFFFRRLQRFDLTTMEMVDSTLKTELAFNPLIYCVYKSYIGPFAGSAGAFAGYNYVTYSFIHHQFPYALLLTGGTTIGQFAAVQADFAVSHKFLIMGIQAPFYVSRFFSLTPGVKYPLIFEATNLNAWRITMGVSTRF